MNRSVAVCAAVMLAATTACGAPVRASWGEPATAQEAGECQPEGGLDEGTDVLSAAVSRASLWFEVKDIQAAELASERALAVVTAGAAVRGEPQDSYQLEMPTRTFQMLRSELDAGAAPLMAVTLGGDERTHFELATVTRENGPVFVGNCFDRYTSELERFSKSRGESRAQSLRDLIADNAGERKALARAEQGAPTPPFSDRQPRERQLVDGETPESVLRALEQVQVRLAFPADWRTFNARLCPYTSVGWSTCINFDAEPLETVGNPASLSFFSYKRPGEPLELWLVDKEFGIQKPIVLVQRVRPAANVVFVARRDLKTLDQVVAASRRGEVIFEARAE